MCRSMSATFPGGVPASSEGAQLVLQLPQWRPGGEPAAESRMHLPVQAQRGCTQCLFSNVKFQLVVSASPRTKDVSNDNYHVNVDILIECICYLS